VFHDLLGIPSLGPGADHLLDEILSVWRNALPTLIALLDVLYCYSGLRVFIFLMTSLSTSSKKGGRPARRKWRIIPADHMSQDSS
jgi:hypothetical protein